MAAAASARQQGAPAVCAAPLSSSRLICVCSSTLSRHARLPPPLKQNTPNNHKTTKQQNNSDKELAKFEAFLNKEGCMHISALVRGRSRMAYPIKTNWEGIYVLYTYAARRATARTVQLLLSNPEAGSEDKLLRHITFCKY